MTEGSTTASEPAAISGPTGEAGLRTAAFWAFYYMGQSGRSLSGPPGTTGSFWRHVPMRVCSLAALIMRRRGSPPASITHLPMPRFWRRFWTGIFRYFWRRKSRKPLRSRKMRRSLPGRFPAAYAFIRKSPPGASGAPDGTGLSPRMTGSICVEAM